jgi:hypothetical protein
LPAPVEASTRVAWLDRLFEAHVADRIPYIEQLAEYGTWFAAAKDAKSNRHTFTADRQRATVSRFSESR